MRRSGVAGERGEEVGGAPAVGKHELWVELDERLEREAALRKPGVRDDEAGLVDRLVAVEKEVEIDRSRPVSRPRSLAAERALDREQAVEEGSRRERRLERGNRVQKPSLIAIPDRVGLVHPRDGDDLDVGLGAQTLDGQAKVRAAVAHVPAQADVRPHRE